MRQADYITGGLVIVALYLYFKREAGRAVESINPLNRENIINSGINGAFNVIGDTKNESIGGAISNHCVKTGTDETGNFDPENMAWYCPTP